MSHHTFQCVTHTQHASMGHAHTTHINGSHTREYGASPATATAGSSVPVF